MTGEAPVLPVGPRPRQDLYEFRTNGAECSKSVHPLLWAAPNMLKNRVLFSVW